VDRNGPMADLWPTLWTADGQGLIVIPTLETSWQTIRIPGESKPVRVKIPPLPAPPRTLTVTVRKQEARHHVDSGPDPDTAYVPSVP
jgi:hypothetical protein